MLLLFRFGADTSTRVAVNSFWCGLMIYGHTQTQTHSETHVYTNAHTHTHKGVNRCDNNNNNNTKLGIEPQKKRQKIASNSNSIETLHHA